MNNIHNFKKKNFIIYGLGKTGKSNLEFLKRKKIKKVITWDDSSKIKNNINKKRFLIELNKAHFIIISPGINIKKTPFKKQLLKNKYKIITDIDLFYLSNNPEKTIMVTGTNGKSTTCSIIEHIFKKKGFKTELCGNIGRPILKQKFDDKKIYIIESSSYQLEYSKFIKPTFALFLNISKDHINWHGSMKNYINSKLKIFKNQTSDDYSFIKDKNLILLYKKNKYRGKLIVVKKNYINQELIKYPLKFQTEFENIEFALDIANKFNIKRNFFFKSLKSFKGLKHRHEIFLKTRKYIFINDSKATSFEASKKAILKNNDIVWILGGLPKIGDKINIRLIKNRVLHAFIFGNNTKFFSNILQGKINFTIRKNLEDIVKLISKKILYKKKITILFSPASASFDQFRDFEERGDAFKRYVKNYAKRFF